MPSIDPMSKKRNDYAREYMRKWRKEHSEQHKETRRKWREAHPHYDRDQKRKRREEIGDLQTLYRDGRKYNLRYLYGVSLEEYDEMFEKQNGVCAVCGKTNGSRRLCVDHDHKTGEVRGLLCHHCNTALGMVDDNIELLMQLVRYLER